MFSYFPETRLLLRKFCLKFAHIIVVWLHSVALRSEQLTGWFRGSGLQGKTAVIFKTLTKI